MSEKKQGQQPETEISIPIEWTIPDSVQSHYASNVFVQPGEYEIALSFFETRLPLLTGSPEEKLAKIKQLGSVQAKCNARIIIPPELVPKLIQALQEGLEGYITSKRIREGDSDK